MQEYIDIVWPFVMEWYWLPLAILYVGIISTILIENRNPSKTIAWMLVIIFLPLVGIVLYYLFGQKFKKEQRLKRSSQDQLDKVAAAFNTLAPQINDSLYRLQQEIGPLSRIYDYLKNERVCFPAQHNALTLFQNGERKFEHMLDTMRSAQHSIHLEYYIFDMDEIGSKVMQVLEEKAASGVQVRLLIDAFGSPQLVKYLQKHPSHIQFHVFLPVTFTSLANSNYRNHRKICIVDGVSAYIGGINIADHYINPNKTGRYWRDTAVNVVGDAVALLQVHFWTLWTQAGGDSFSLSEPFINMSPNSSGNATVAFAASDPGSPAPFNMEALLIAITSAKHHIQLCTPYYIPSEELQTALLVAAASGVKVELLVPAKGDSWIVQHASFSFLKPLLKRGIQVYLYEKGFLHAKTVNVDDQVVFIGTVNLDTRSFYINYEIAAVIADKSLGQQMDADFQMDKQGSTLLTLEKWAARPGWKKGVDSVCRLLAPLL